MFVFLFVFVKALVSFDFTRARKEQDPFQFLVVKEIVEILKDVSGLNNLKIIYSGGDRGWVGDVPKFKYDLIKIKKLNWIPKLSSNEAVKMSLINELKNRGN